MGFKTRWLKLATTKKKFPQMFIFYFVEVCFPLFRNTSGVYFIFRKYISIVYIFKRHLVQYCAMGCAGRLSVDHHGHFALTSKLTSNYGTKLPYKVSKQ